MDNAYFKKILEVIIVVGLMVVSFLILKPILLYIALGFILAFIFFPIYSFVYKITKSPNFSASLMCILIISITLLPIWFFTPIVIDQAFKIYLFLQEVDFTAILHSVFPSLFASEQFSAEIGSLLQSFTTNVVNSLLSSLSKIILDFPTILLHSIVVLFTFFFALRDKDKLLEYVKSLSPFPKSVEEKLFQSSKDITTAVIYGEIVVGIIQGVILGIGFFLFGVPNALVLSLVAIVAGVLPIIGPMLVWIPVFVYLYVTGNVFAAIGVLIFGLVSSNIDNVLKPLFISKRTKIHSSIVLIGMIGGLFLFGVLGLILGPLIFAYLLIIIEIYRDKSPKNTPTANS